MNFLCGPTRSRASSVRTVGNVTSMTPDEERPLTGKPLSRKTVSMRWLSGMTCAVNVVFQPTSNASPQPYTAVLHVTATPGSDAQASLSGTAD